MSVDPAEVLLDNSEGEEDDSVEIPEDHMDVSSQQSNCFGNGIVVSKKGSGGTHRVWSQCEEKVLLAALKDLVAKGKKLIMASVLVT
ncbi:hypothetical protein ACS0TY_033657 [Phlomoides rotata]